MKARPHGNGDGDQEAHPEEIVRAAAQARGEGSRRRTHGSGCKAFAKKDGSRLKPGVRGAADTPEKMKRKGSFLRRHFATPRGPMADEHGEPTRLALSAHAWGEPVPKNLADAKRLALKGAVLLARYAKASAAEKAAPTKKTAAKKEAAPTKRRPARVSRA